MTDPVLERYKEALKAGHVAVLRGRHEEAMARYREAAAAAPDRPLPYTSLGGVLARLGRFEDARAAYSAALALGSRDESALTGLAKALLAVGRKGDAAAALDRLAELQASTARIPEALETLRQADGLEADRGRAKRIAEFEAAIEGAPLRVAKPARAARPAAPSTPAAGSVPGAPARPPRQYKPRVPLPRQTAEPDAAHVAARRKPPPPPPEEIKPNIEMLVDEAETAVDEGRTDAAQAAFAAAAVAYLAAGMEAAAIDVCQRGLQLGPTAPALHLQLTRAYLALGWRPRALAKLRLLDRLLEIDGDRTWRLALADVARSGGLAGEPELAGIMGAEGGSKGA
jgi:tetratricopeptide (TPR) repeat protein